MMWSPVIKRWLAGATVAIVTAGSGVYRFRDQQMDKLYAEAAGIPPAFRGVAEAQAAVRKLGTYRGDRSTVMLLNIALGRTPFAWPEIQREAMNTLASRRDSKISPPLADLLQPHVPLPIRQDAANALRSVPCTIECVQSILHYLERVWEGEPNYEDRTVFPSGLNEGVRADLAKDQEALYQTLYAVLKREGESTMAVLYQVYGIGTNAPSKFGIIVLSRINSPGGAGL